MWGAPQALGFNKSTVRPYPLRPAAKTLPRTASNGNDGAVAVDCDSRRAFGPTKTIRGVFWTQLNRLEHLAVLLALRERSF